jgi:hypothetical protein
MLPYTFYCSGANREGEYIGLANVGINYGISLKDISKPRLDDIISRAQDNPSVKIFVDSGAFGEVAYDKQGKRSIVSPITDSLWSKKLDVYDRIALVYGKRAVVVAPDCVGDQKESLVRLRRHKTRVLSLLGVCQVIVPLQIGVNSLQIMYQDVIEILGTTDFIVGVPCKKSATPLRELRLFLDKASPRSIHLLGVSPCSKKWDSIRAVIQSLDTKPMYISLDAVRLRSLVMRTTYKGELTARLDYYKKLGYSPTDAMIAAIADIKDSILKEYPQRPYVVGLFG